MNMRSLCVIILSSYLMNAPLEHVSNYQKTDSDIIVDSNIIDQVVNILDNEQENSENIKSYIRSIMRQNVINIQKTVTKQKDIPKYMAINREPLRIVLTEPAQEMLGNILSQDNKQSLDLTDNTKLINQLVSIQIGLFNIVVDLVNKNEITDEIMENFYIQNRKDSTRDLIESVSRLYPDKEKCSDEQIESLFSMHFDDTVFELDHDDDYLRTFLEGEYNLYYNVDYSSVFTILKSLFNGFPVTRGFSSSNGSNPKCAIPDKCDLEQYLVEQSDHISYIIKRSDHNYINDSTEIAIKGLIENLSHHGFNQNIHKIVGGTIEERMKHEMYNWMIQCVMEPVRLLREAVSKQMVYELHEILIKILISLSKSYCLIVDIDEQNYDGTTNNRQVLITDDVESIEDVLNNIPMALNKDSFKDDQSYHADKNMGTASKEQAKKDGGDPDAVLDRRYIARVTLVTVNDDLQPLAKDIVENWKEFSNTTTSLNKRDDEYRKLKTSIDLDHDSVQVKSMLDQINKLTIQLEKKQAEINEHDDKLSESLSEETQKKIVKIRSEKSNIETEIQKLNTTIDNNDQFAKIKSQLNELDLLNKGQYEDINKRDALLKKIYEQQEELFTSVEHIASLHSELLKVLTYGKDALKLIENNYQDTDELKKESSQLKSKLQKQVIEEKKPIAEIVENNEKLQQFERKLFLCKLHDSIKDLHKKPEVLNNILESAPTEHRESVKELIQEYITIMDISDSAH